MEDSPLSLFSPAPFLIRPLLGTPRVAIEAYCRRTDLRPRFDRSNEDTTLYRNRLRHELMPILESYNPRIREVLAHTAEVLSGDHELLRLAVDEAWDRVRTQERESGGVWGRRPLARPFSPSSDGFHLDLAAWRALPLGLHRATLREAIHGLRASLRNINWEHVERAVWLARDGGTGQKATLAAGLGARDRRHRTLRIGPETASTSPQWVSSQLPGDSPPGGGAMPAASPVPQIDAPLPLATPGETAIGVGWWIEVSSGCVDALLQSQAEEPIPRVAFLNADVLSSGLMLRTRQPGDRFQPQGLDGHSMKLNALMINAKNP